MAWVILVIAGFLEIGWAVGLSSTNGFTRLWPTISHSCRAGRQHGASGFGRANAAVGNGVRCVDGNRHSRHRDSRHGPAW